MIIIIIIKLLLNNAPVSRIRNRRSLKNIFQSGNTTLIVLNEEMDDMKINESLEESGLFIKCISRTIQNGVKEQKGGFLSMLLGIFGVSLLGNLFTDEGGKWSNIVEK